MAQGAALEEMASSELGLLLAHKRSFACTGVEARNSALLHKIARREGAPRRVGPAVVLEIYVRGVAVKFE